MKQGFLRPEEKEYLEKQQELLKLESDMLDREIELSELKINIKDVENRYLALVGTQLYRIDLLKVRLLQLIDEFEVNAQNTNYYFQQMNFDFQYERSDQNVKANETSDYGPLPEELKSIYRDVVKKIHPDLANNAHDLAYREDLMKKANDAFSRRDSETLLKILEEWDSRPEEVNGNDVGSKLIRIIRKISIVKDAIKRIEAEKKELEGTELYSLYIQVEEASYSGVDLIQEISNTVKIQSGDILLRLQELSVYIQQMGSDQRELHTKAP